MPSTSSLLLMVATLHAAVGQDASKETSLCAAQFDSCISQGDSKEQKNLDLKVGKELVERYKASGDHKKNNDATHESNGKKLRCLQQFDECTSRCNPLKLYSQLAPEKYFPRIPYPKCPKRQRLKR